MFFSRILYCSPISKLFFFFADTGNLPSAGSDFLLHVQRPSILLLLYLLIFTRHVFCCLPSLRLNSPSYTFDPIYYNFNGPIVKLKIFLNPKKNIYIGIMTTFKWNILFVYCAFKGNAPILHKNCNNYTSIITQNDNITPIVLFNRNYISVGAEIM